MAPRQAKHNGKVETPRRHKQNTNADTNIVADHIAVELAFGFRAYATVIGATPGVLLNTVVPLVAMWRGDVTLPNVMLSDVMASHPLYSSIYTWGFTLTMAAVCFVFQESSTFWRREVPVLRRHIDQFMFLLYTLCAPCLFGLVAFQYRHDMSFKSGGIIAMINDFDFVLWALHCGHTGVFFLACCAMAYIYSQKLQPALDAKRLVHPADRFWRDFSTLGIVSATPFGIVVRLLHLFMGGTLWGVLLIIIEVGLIQAFLCAAFGGVFRLMMQLDASEPMLLWESLEPLRVGSKEKDAE